MPKPTSVTLKLYPHLSHRLDVASKRVGIDRTGLMRLFLILFLDALETNDYHIPGAQA